MQMELRHLRYFEAVARYSHVTRAAAELHIAQPALSKQVSQLEQELGVALFDRVGRNVRLTEAGEALLPHVRAILAQIESARAEMSERVGLRRGRARIGTPPSVGTQLLPKALSSFHDRYPGIELRLFEAGIQTLLELLESGMADVAIASLPVDDPNLTVVPLFSEDLVIVLSKEHPLAEQQSVAMTDLKHEQWILSPDNYELRDATLNACKKAGFAPQVALDGGEMDTLLRLVVAGVGIAMVPSLVVQNICCEMAVLTINDQNIQRSLGLVWRSDRVASPAARALREFLIDHLLEEYNEKKLIYSQKSPNGHPTKRVA
jgi:DNA-binding transcriptional LysR family regulator